MKRTLFILCFSLTNMIFASCPEVLDNDLRVLAPETISSVERQQEEKGE